MSAHLTPWFPGDVRPVHVGWYERYFSFGVEMNWWNGAAWLDFPGGARVDVRHAKLGKPQWRGIIGDPQAVRIENNRRAFEQWLPSLYGLSVSGACDFTRSNDGTYRYYETERAWRTWQAGNTSPYRPPMSHGEMRTFETKVATEWFRDHPAPAELNAILGARWAICRSTPELVRRYGRCISHEQYADACAEALRRRRE